MRLLQLLLLVMGGCAHFMGHVHVNVPGRLDTRVNYTMFKHDGFVIVDDVFTRAEIDLMRRGILQLAGNESTQFKPWFVPSALDPGLTIPDFMARDTFDFLHHLPNNPAVLRVLHILFGPKPFRYCGHNDIGISRIVGWHKDKLNGPYAKYQTLPLWGKDQPEGGHFIVKVAIYLQDHTHDDDSLVIVPGSHTTPSYTIDRATHLHPRKGSIVVFEQRATHRGQQWSPARLIESRQNKHHRIMVSLGFGVDNIFTRQFEQGTLERQTDQCGDRCQRRKRRLR